MPVKDPVKPPPTDPLPPPGPKPFFSILDGVLSEEIRKQIGRPFWIDTVDLDFSIEATGTVVRSTLVMRRNPAVTAQPLVLDGGHLLLPSGPGLGVTLDRAVVDRYRVC